MTKVAKSGAVEETELWEAFLRGKQPALADLFLAQYDRLYRYGYRLYGEEELVKDCIQELFLKLWQKQCALHEVREVGPYLCKALRRGIIDSLRQRSRYSKILDFMAQNPLEVSFSQEEFLISQQIDEEQRQRLTTALNRLTKRQREAIHLRYFENFEPAQIAQIMNLSDQSVYNLLYRSVQALRDHFFLLLLVSLN
jgi:RNA polymerase sigma factor (sigma-70 family)